MRTCPSTAPQASTEQAGFSANRMNQAWASLRGSSCTTRQQTVRRLLKIWQVILGCHATQLSADINTNAQGIAGLVPARDMPLSCVAAAFAKAEVH